MISGIQWNYRHEMLSLQMCDLFQDSEMRNASIDGTLEAEEGKESILVQETQRAGLICQSE